MKQRLIELKNDGQKILKLAKEYLGEGFYYIEEIGIPKAEIDEILQNTPHDLLVTGTRGRSLIAGIFLGSIAEHLLHTSIQPLLIVP